MNRVTLIGVSDRDYYLTKRSLIRSSANLNFYEVLFFSSLHDNSLGRIKCIKIKPINSVEDYNSFIIKNLYNFIKTSHVLIVQWDGYVVNEKLFDFDFLCYDYIGAIWPHFLGRNYPVGNGGFSLRSRALLEYLSCSDYNNNIPEDLYICHNMRSDVNFDQKFKFAPLSVARRFSVEREFFSNIAFGTHGIFNVPKSVNFRNIYRYAVHTRWFDIKLSDAVFFALQIQKKFGIYKSYKIFLLILRNGRIYV